MIVLLFLSKKVYLITFPGTFQVDNACSSPQQEVEKLTVMEIRKAKTQHSSDGIYINDYDNIYHVYSWGKLLWHISFLYILNGWRGYLVDAA